MDAIIAREPEVRIAGWSWKSPRFGPRSRNSGCGRSIPHAAVIHEGPSTWQGAPERLRPQPPGRGQPHDLRRRERHPGAGGQGLRCGVHGGPGSPLDDPVQEGGTLHLHAVHLGGDGAVRVFPALLDEDRGLLGEEAVDEVLGGRRSPGRFSSQTFNDPGWRSGGGNARIPSSPPIQNRRFSVRSVSWRLPHDYKRNLIKDAVKPPSGPGR